MPSVQDLIRQAAKEQGVPPELALGVAEQESSFNPTVTNPQSGAIGTFQILPATGKMLGIDPADPKQNIAGGVKYLRQLMDQHQGNLEQVLATYGGVKTDTTYVPSTLAKVQRWKQQPSAATAPPEGVTPPPAPRSLVDRGLDVGKSVLAGFDPRTSTGRQNLAGGLGAIGLTAVAPELALPAGLARLASVAIPAAGAYLGGAAAQAGEDVAAGRPPTPSSLMAAGRGQAEQEVVGQAVAWPLKAVGRRLIGGTVAKQAGERLAGMRAATEAQVSTALNAAQDALSQAKVRAGQMVEHVGQRLNMTRPAVSASRTGEMVNQVAQGPAKTTLNRLGEHVGESARGGPSLPTAPLRARLDELKQQITPMTTHTPPPLALPPSTGGTSAASQAIAKRQAELLTVPELPPEHPLPGLLDRIANVLEQQDSISFEDAHKTKRLLDEAVNWAAPAKKQAQQITKGFRQTLRELMSSHEPYNQATAAYAQAEPLFNKGIVRDLQKAAQTSPESIVRLVKGHEPTKLKMLFEALDMAEPSGGGQAAQSAKAAVQSAWTYEKLIKGGPAKLTDRINALDPEFVATMYGDPAGKTVLGNLQQIGQAFKDAEARGALGIEQAKEGVRGAKQAVRAAKVPTDLERQFGKAKLGAQDTAGIARDIGYSVLMPHRSVTGIGAVARTILHGPAVNDLVQWASYSKPRTDFLVKHVLTGPNVGMALTDFYRWWQDSEGQPDRAVPSHDTPTGPPPQPRSIAAQP
jgi:hypothetical protein